MSSESLAWDVEEERYLKISMALGEFHVVGDINTCERICLFTVDAKTVDLQSCHGTKTLPRRTLALYRNQLFFTAEFSEISRYRLLSKKLLRAIVVSAPVVGFQASCMNISE